MPEHPDPPDGEVQALAMASSVQSSLTRASILRHWSTGFMPARTVFSARARTWVGAGLVTVLAHQDVDAPEAGLDGGVAAAMAGDQHELAFDLASGRRLQDADGFDVGQQHSVGVRSSRGQAGLAGLLRSFLGSVSISFMGVGLAPRGSCPPYPWADPSPTAPGRAPAPRRASGLAPARDAARAAGCGQAGRLRRRPWSAAVTGRGRVRPLSPAPSRLTDRRHPRMPSALSWLDVKLRHL